MRLELTPDELLSTTRAVRKRLDLTRLVGERVEAWTALASEHRVRLVADAPAVVTARVLAPSTLRSWLIASRPHTLTIGVNPVLVGSALAWAETGRLDIPLMLLSMLGALLLQTGTNLDNIQRVRFDLASGKVHQMTPQQAT